MKRKQTKSRLWKRLGAWALSLALVVGLLPQTAFATDTGKAIQLGASGIKDPTETTAAKGKYYYTPNSYIYFGVKGSDPIKWRVLDADKTNDGTTNGMFLLSEYLLDSGVVFESERNSDDNDGQINPNEWQHSDAQKWCTAFASNLSNFSTAEQSAMQGIAKEDNSETLYIIPWGESSLTENDKVFFLSARELTDYVGSYDGAPGLKATDTAQKAVGWWLRSPDSGSRGNNAGLVNDLGVMYSWHVDYAWAARPAFNLNLNSVLFTSAAEDGKTDSTVDGNLTEVAAYDGNEWKLTLLDESRNFDVTKKNTSGNPGETITLNYTGATTGTNEYISVLLTDQQDNALYYGRVAQPQEENGTVEVAIPTDLALGQYTLNVFNEQYNGNYKTDYASAFATVDLTVEDTIAPILSGGSAIRDSATTATVKFTSDEAGTYYYVVDNSATAPDSINTATAGTSCSANIETTITLDSLSGEYIHIVVKDAADNVSDVLTIQIPAYTFTVTVNVDQQGGGTVSANYTTAAPDTEITLTATPETGYHFKEWQVTSGSLTISENDKAKNPLTVYMPAGNVTVKAVFAAHDLTPHNAKEPTCTETGNSQYWECSVCKQLFSDENGTISTYLQAVTILATGHTAGETWQHDNGSTHWKECEDCGAKVDETAHVYDNGQDDTCDVCNHKRDTYTLTVDLNNGSGSATGGKYAAGAVISIDAGTRTNYRFTGWTSSNGGDFASASSASTTFTMPANDTTITANWRYTGGGSTGGGSGSSGSATYVPSVDAGRNGDVTVSPSRPSSGQTVTITVDPDAGYELDDLTVTDARGNVVKVTDNGDGTYSFTQPSSKVTIEATFRETGAAADCPRDDTCPLAKFTDLDRNAWYHDGIHYCVENGLMAGTNATTFAPDVTTSRAMIAVILWRQAGSPAAEEYTDFSDVADGAWHTEGIRWASNAGVVMGYPDGIFRPNDPITREQMAAMLYRYAVYQGMESVTLEENLAGFTDADKISGYAIQAMNWAVGQGIMGGYGDNTLRPQGNATRAQAAAMLQRFCEKFGE